jgi:hypothetical protein
MSAEQENFEKLRRLLAIKRHEQPPPGYFNGFSRQVIARIQAGETENAGSFFQRLMGRAPWLQSLWRGFEAKPIVAGAFGVGVCSLLVVGLISSERIDSQTAVLSGDNAAQQAILATVPRQTVGSSLFERAAADHVVTGAVYTAQSRSSIFDEIQRPHVQPVSYSASAPAN